jgi:hypothetical protein
MKSTALKTVILGLNLAIAVSACAQAPAPRADVVGTWHLVHIDSSGPDGKVSQAAQPTGLLIYTLDRHASVQLMYPQTSLSNEFVHDGYEATFGTYDLDAEKHQLTYHVQASATREKLVGRSETLHYEFPDSKHMIIRPTQADQHWSVTWQRY